LRSSASIFFSPAGKRVGDVFEEDQAENGVLIDSGIEIGAEPVGGGPELLVKLAEKLLGVGGHKRKSDSPITQRVHGECQIDAHRQRTHRQKADANCLSDINFKCAELAVWSTAVLNQTGTERHHHEYPIDASDRAEAVLSTPVGFATGAQRPPV